MSEESKPPHTRLSGIGHFLLITAISSGILMLVMAGLGKTGAKPYLDELTANTGNALKQLTPLALGRRYVDIFVEKQMKNPGGVALMRMLDAFFALIGQIFSESWTQSVVDVLQLAAGLIVALTLISWLKPLRDMALHPVFPMVFILLWIGCACVLSYAMVAIVYLGASTLGDMVPSHTRVSLAAGAWSGIVVSWSQHTLEDALSHGTGHVVERTLKGMLRIEK